MRSIAYWVRYRRVERGYHVDWVKEALDVTIDAARQQAAERGQWVYEPDADELLIDLDSQRAYRTFKDRLALLEEANVFNEPRSLCVQIDRSSGYRWWRRRYHVRMRFPRTLSAAERIAWQAALGSDALRELLSLVRVTRGIEPATIFFENPQSQPVRGIAVME